MTKETRPGEVVQIEQGGNSYDVCIVRNSGDPDVDPLATLFKGQPSSAQHRRRIYIIDDHVELYDAVFPALNNSGYDCVLPDIRNVTSSSFWSHPQTKVELDDIIVLDLNFKDAVNEEGNKINIKYSGLDVLTFFERNSGTEKPMENLRRVLVASSHEGLFSSPVIALQSRFALYTMAKITGAQTAQGTVADYATRIPSLVEQIYKNELAPVNAKFYNSR